MYKDVGMACQKGIPTSLMFFFVFLVLNPNLIAEYVCYVLQSTWSLNIIMKQCFIYL